jgi:uncharacterized membrane protein
VSDHHDGHDDPLFGTDTFGRIAEAIARFLGTPAFLVGQTVLTGAWLVLNMYLLSKPFDPCPFFILNFAYTIQSGFAAPFILCAQVRQDARDKLMTDADAAHREAIAAEAHAKLEALEVLILSLLTKDKK